MRFSFLLAFAVIATASSSQAATVVVDAFAHSVYNTPGRETVLLPAGQAFVVRARTDDLWSSGPLPRWSNADGLTGDRFATGGDESGEPAGTLIGVNWGLFDFDGYSAPFGSLVGRVGDGSYFLVGTSFSGRADTSGMLRLFYWDGFSDDNFGVVTAEVSAVPLPPSLALQLFAILGGAVVAIRRRRLLSARLAS